VWPYARRRARADGRTSVTVRGHRGGLPFRTVIAPSCERVGPTPKCWPERPGARGGAPEDRRWRAFRYDSFSLHRDAQPGAATSPEVPCRPACRGTRRHEPGQQVGLEAAEFFRARLAPDAHAGHASAPGPTRTPRLHPSRQIIIMGELISRRLRGRSGRLDNGGRPSQVLVQARSGLAGRDQRAHEPGDYCLP